MRHFQFSEDEYNKLSTVTGVPAIELQKLDALGLLVNEVAVRLVFEYEYNIQKKVTKVLPKLIIQAIANKYGMSVDKVRKYLFARERPIHYCSKCHKEISNAERKRNDGVCDKCVVDSITL